MSVPQQPHDPNFRNCLVLRYTLTVRHLKNLIKRTQIVMNVLMETKQVEPSSEQVRRKADMDNVEYVFSMGDNCGLALWWTKEVSVIILR